MFGLVALAEAAVSGCAIVLALCAAPAGAQLPSGASDAVILVQPMGGQAMVAVVFPGPTPSAAVRARLVKLARSAGWALLSLEIKDEHVRTNPKFGGVKGLGTQTGASALLGNAPQFRNGGFILQPYLEAFADLKRIEILYMVPADRAFQGLRDFESPSLTVRLVTGGGPYRYVAEIRDHSGILPTVPLTQPMPLAARRVRAAVSHPTRLDSSAMALVLAVAAGGGLVALMIGLALGARQNRRPTYREQTHRASRS